MVPGSGPTVLIRSVDPDLLNSKKGIARLIANQPGEKKHEQKLRARTEITGTRVNQSATNRLEIW